MDAIMLSHSTMERAAPWTLFPPRVRLFAVRLPLSPISMRLWDRFLPNSLHLDFQPWQPVRVFITKAFPWTSSTLSFWFLSSPKSMIFSPDNSNNN